MNITTSTTRRIAPALVLSAVVIGAATTGSAVAANLVTSKGIKDGTIQTVDVKNRTLTGKDIKTASLQEKQLATGVKAKLNEPAVQGYEVITATDTIDAGSPGTTFVACTGDKLAIGGGGGFVNDDQSLTVQGSQPYEFLEETVLFAPPFATHADGWGVTGFNGLANLEDLTAYVICVDPS